MVDHFLTYILSLPGRNKARARALDAILAAGFITNKRGVIYNNFPFSFSLFPHLFLHVLSPIRFSPRFVAWQRDHTQTTRASLTRLTRFNAPTPFVLRRGNPGARIHSCMHRDDVLQRRWLRASALALDDPRRRSSTVVAAKCVNKCSTVIRLAFNPGL